MQICLTGWNSIENEKIRKRKKPAADGKIRRAGFFLQASVYKTLITIYLNNEKPLTGMVSGFRVL